MAQTELKGRKNRVELKPFYLANGTTSAEIIAEARTSVRYVDTKRPCTPVEAQRTLFGSSRRQENPSRPPSAFSIGPRHFVEPDLPSPTTLVNRLEPLAKAPDVPDGEEVFNTIPVVVEADRKVKENLSQSRNVNPVKCTTHVDGPIHPSPPKPLRPYLAVSRRSSTGNITRRKLVETEPRRVHSGPSKRRLEKNNNIDQVTMSSSPHTVQENAMKDCSKNEADLNAVEGKKLSCVYKKNVRPILKEMDKNLQEDDGSSLCENCQKLLSTLKNVGILPETNAVQMVPAFKAQILKCLFGYLEVKNPRLHLRLAKIALLFKLSENNYENIFKLLFKVSRDESNDLMFLEEDLTDILIAKVFTFDGCGKYEAWIYSVGTLKLLSGNSVIRRHLVNTGCVQALAIVLQYIIKQDPVADVKLRKKNTNILFPVTAVLRNLADVNGSRDIFMKKKILPHLVRLLNIFRNDSDIVMNICRIISKMTLYDECCAIVTSSNHCFETFLNVLDIHLKSQEIVVRVLFILGNLTTKCDDARFDLFFTEGSTKHLLLAFHLYFERNIEACKFQTAEKTAEQVNTEDVLNKMVRVIANLCIHCDVGPAICNNTEFIGLLLQVLEVKDLAASEELLLNTVATINNLSYYTEEDDALAKQRDVITQLLMGILVADNMDAILEASRVLGNFSRFKNVRDILSSHKVDEMMISLLDSGNHEIVFTACGVLINMMVDHEKRPVLKQEGGIKKLIDVLRDFGKIDWQLAAMVCQTLWNYGENTSNLFDHFGGQETIVLTDLLREYLDEESAFEYLHARSIEESVKQMLHETWKNSFQAVGEQLLQKLESMQTDLVPLEDPT